VSVPLQQLCHVALMLRMKVCDHHKGHACIGWQRIKNAPNASSPPAEAPMPTIVKPASLLAGSTGAGASILRGFFVVGVGVCFDFLMFS